MSTLTTKQLVEKGYFPQEIMPSFTTTNLAAKLPTLTSLIANKPHVKTSKCEHITIPKTHTARRIISIPNPFHQIRLSQTIADGWADIETNTSLSVLSQSPLKLSHPTWGTRCFTKTNFFDNGEKRLGFAGTSRYLLKFDISRFYPSIYTHSISWALHTKAVAKDRKRDLTLLGNRIDSHVQSTQDAQTNGIPIGPDTSRAISEVIATAIDLSLTRVMPNVKGARYVDDYFLYFPNYKQLEEANAIIHNCLSEYHLEYNESKFQIIELPESFIQQWTASLAKFKFNNNPRKQNLDLFQYFSLAYEYNKQFPKDYVLSYAVARLQKVIIHRNNWNTLEDFLLHTLFIESKTIRYVCNILTSYKRAGYNINIPKIKEFLNAFIILHNDKSQPFEIAWACWLAKQLSIKLNPDICKILSNHVNSLVAIIALDMQSSDLLDAKLDDSKWQTLCTTNNLYSEHWLLVYESIKQGWIKKKKTFFNSDPFFKILHDNDVRFYDNSRRAIGRVMRITSPPSDSDYLF